MIACECGDHAFVKASKWAIVLVSIDDVDRLSHRKWTLVTPKRGYFYARSEKLARESGTAGYIHREVLSAPSGVLVDHINHNGLDNRRSNLRLASRADNLANRKSPRSGAQKNSGTGRPFKASMKAGGASIHLGYFDTAEEASAAYRQAAEKRYGEFFSGVGRR